MTNEEIIEENPDIILVSWFDKFTDKKSIRNRLGGNLISVIRNDPIYEIPAEYVTQLIRKLLRGLYIWQKLWIYLTARLTIFLTPTVF